MSEQKYRPKREEVAYILLAYDKDVKLCMPGDYTGHPSITESIDKILALFPDIKQEVQTLRNYVFVESAFGSEEKKMQMQAMVFAYDVVLRLLKPMDSKKVAAPNHLKLEDPGPWGTG